MKKKKSVIIKLSRPKKLNKAFVFSLFTSTSLNECLIFKYRNSVVTGVSSIDDFFFTALADYQLSLVAQEQLIFPELVNILDP